MITRHLNNEEELLVLIATSLVTFRDEAVTLCGFSETRTRQAIWAATGRDYFIVCEHENEIIGWLSAQSGLLAEYSIYRSLNMKHCQIFVKGRKAVEALRLLHDELYRETTRRHLALATSSSSMSTRDVFNRILASWTEDKGILLRTTRYHPSHPGYKKNRTISDHD